MNGIRFDIVVVGGGHAGIEAALAAAGLGARTALVTHDPNEIGRMPCNPAIGGLGKGHLVREIDVLGGEMGLAIDETGIQFRILNRKKGPAVQSPRAQADKLGYQRRMTTRVHDQAGLTVIAGDAAGLLTGSGRVVGVRLQDGREVHGARLVLCTGTFLKGLMHVGEEQTVGGREGAASAEGLSADLRAAGFELRRLKTGTPPRLARESIDFQQLVEQPGDEPPQPFSFRTGVFAPEQTVCWKVHTNERTHAVITAALDRSPLYGGAIAGRGPRYCPSIEDKVVRFADKDRHLLFLEPEGVASPEIYVNGLSTSLPAEVQEDMVRSLPGLDRAVLLRYGYAVEYDSVPSWQIHASLESKPLAGLYLAGQILGTSGYEEAAGQGFLAGVNAVRSLDGEGALDLGRDTAYLGVLVDDLVTKEIDEPYRMFTSRAEHRLHLRCDNTEERLTDHALALGLLPRSVQEQLRARRVYLGGVAEVTRRTTVRDPATRVGMPLREWFRTPGRRWWDAEDLQLLNTETTEIFNTLTATYMAAGANRRQVDDVLHQVENEARYEGYIIKQNKMLRGLIHLDELELPEGLDYLDVTALSYEAREKLERVRPRTLGQASRIDGVRAGDLAVLTVVVKRHREAAAEDSA